MDKKTLGVTVDAAIITLSEMTPVLPNSEIIHIQKTSEETNSNVNSILKSSWSKFKK